MKALLSPYIDIRPGDAEEINRIIDQIESTIQDQFDAGELEEVKKMHPTFRRVKRFITLSTLELVTGYGKERISEFRNGRSEPPDHFMVRLRVLRDRVIESPERARASVLDWLERRRSSV